MAALTWREVSAPNFGGVQDSINSAAKLLNGATTGVSQALGQFGDQNVLQQLAQYNDAQKLQADLQSGQFSTANASAEALGKIMGRPSALIDNAAAQQQMEYRAALNPTVIEGQKLMNTSTGLANDHAVVMNPLKEASSRQANVSNLDTFNEMVGNRNAGYEATSWFDRNVKNGMFDTPGNIDILRTEVEKMEPRLRARVLPMLAAANPEAFTPQRIDGATAVGSSSPGATGLIAGAAGPTVPSAQGTAGTRKGNSYDVVLGNGEFGFPDKPVSASTLGELGEFGRKVLIPNTRNNEKLGLKDTGKGSSAVGKYQFTQETTERLAPTVFGKDWKNTVFTPENQDKLGEALFNETKGGNLKKIWQGLPNTKEGAYKDIPWSEMKEIISKVESPVDGLDNKSMAKIVKSGTAVAALADTVVRADSMFSANPLAAQIYNAATADPKNLKSEAEVVAELQTTFKDMKPQDIAKLVGETRAKLGGVSAAAVVPLLTNSAGTKGGFLGFGGSYGVDNDKLAANIKSMVGDGKTPGVAFRALMDEQARLQQTQGVGEDLKTTNDDRKKALANLKSKINTLPAGPRRDAQVEAARLLFESDKQDAEAAVSAAAARGLPYNPVAPAPVAPTSTPVPVSTLLEKASTPTLEKLVGADTGDASINAIVAKNIPRIQAAADSVKVAEQQMAQVVKSGDPVAIRNYARTLQDARDSFEKQLKDMSPARAAEIRKLVA